jgi:pyrroline-5-carboxylate reductase
MLRNLNLAFIGAGQMAEALIGGVLRRELVVSEQIIATGPREERRRHLHEKWHIHVIDDNRAAVRTADIVVLTCKPQTFTKIIPELRGAIRPQALVISILAGTPVARLVEGLDHAAVVRSMPNTPAQISEGITVWMATPAVSETQRDQARLLLSALGEEVLVDEERYLDMATALSGTGPAYFFLLMEALVDAGVHMGFPRWVSEKLVNQTMLGSVRYAMRSGKHPAELRNAVTSPGGTTAAALYEAEKGGLRTVLADSVWAAYRRSVELGNK